MILNLLYQMDTLVEIEERETKKHLKFKKSIDKVTGSGYAALHRLLRPLRRGPAQAGASSLIQTNYWLIPRTKPGRGCAVTITAK